MALPAQDATAIARRTLQLGGQGLGLLRGIGNLTDANGQTLFSPSTLGTLGTLGSGAGIAAGLAGLASDPTPQGAARFAGQVLASPTTAQALTSLLGNGGATAGLAGQGIELGADAAAAGVGGLAGSLAALPFSVFAGGGPLSLVLRDTESADTLRRRAYRSRDARQLTGELLRGVQAHDLNADVGGASLGDTLASMLNFNQNGTYYDLFNWLPDPALAAFQQRLRDAGYLGTHVGQNGEIIRREPGAGDVGGVGEMIAGGGFALPNTRGRLSVWDVLQSGDTSQGNAGTHAVTPSPYLYGPMAWSELLRGVAGIPASAPSVFDITPLQAPGYGPPITKPWTDLTGGLSTLVSNNLTQSYDRDNPEISDAYNAYLGAQGQAARDYLGALPSDVAETILAQQRERDLAEATRLLQTAP